MKTVRFEHAPFPGGNWDCDDDAAAPGEYVRADVAQKLEEACLYCQNMLQSRVGEETLASRIGLIGGFYAERLLREALTADGEAKT